METAHKNRMLFWSLIFLIIVNVSALATYFFLPGKQSQNLCSNDPDSPNCVLHEQLNLTGEQYELVDAINKDYQAISRPISTQIKDLRSSIVDELESREPDTALINELIEEISSLQMQLHRENINHYLDLKEVCDPDQALRLSNLYRELYGCPMHQGGKKQHQHRHRHR